MFKRANEFEEVQIVKSDDTSIFDKVVSNHKVRQGILWLMDMCSVFLAATISISLLGLRDVESMQFIMIDLFIIMMLHTITFNIYRCYSNIWRYARYEEAVYVLIASTIYLIPLYLINRLMGIDYPVLFYILYAAFTIALSGGIRLIRRIGKKIIGTKIVKDRARVLIIGGGTVGEMVISKLKENQQIGKIPVGIIDDDINKIGRRIHGVKIIGKTREIKDIVNKYEIDEIILAMENESNERKKAIINECKNTKCKFKTVPDILEIINGKVEIKKIRDFKIEDLLEREPIKVDIGKIGKYVEDKVVLVTGGGGSIGSEICRQIASLRPKHLIILDIYENNAYDIQQELIRKYGSELNLSIIIASIREIIRLEEVFKEYKPEIVFHAAAHKHVPLMETSPSEAVKNNIFGTKNVAELSDKYKVHRFVLISSDKAVNPTNIMGATKRAAEMIIQELNQKSETEFVAVRFGNVLGSNGSVVPLFKKQIAEGGPITITHPDIIRYFMTIPEAVQLVMQAGAMAKGGEIFILDMGNPVKIMKLAMKMIELSGFEFGRDIKIEYTGLRPGEKLYEELLMAEEGIINTDNKRIFIGKPIEINSEKVNKSLEILDKIIEKEDVELIDCVMREFVDTYIKPEDANKKEKFDEFSTCT